MCVQSIVHYSRFLVHGDMLIGWRPLVKRLTDSFKRRGNFLQWHGLQHMLCCKRGPCGAPSSEGENGTSMWLSEDANEIRGMYGDQVRESV